MATQPPLVKMLMETFSHHPSTSGFNLDRTHLYFYSLFLSLYLTINYNRYILIAISEIFASITGLEYAFTKAPQNMRSLVMSFFLFTSAVASAIGEAFVCESFDWPFSWNHTNSLHLISFVHGSVVGVELWFHGRYRCDFRCSFLVIS